MAEDSVCRNLEIFDVLVGTASAFRARITAACKYESQNHLARMWLDFTLKNDPDTPCCCALRNVKPLLSVFRTKHVVRLNVSGMNFYPGRHLICCHILENSRILILNSGCGLRHW